MTRPRNMLYVTCETEGCKKLTSHYSNVCQEHRTKTCKHPGCQVRTSKPYCGTHKTQGYGSAMPECEREAM